MNSLNSRTILLGLVLLNVVSTWLHYIDNARFIQDYSGFAWFSPIGIIATVAVMTPVGLLGLWWYWQGQTGRSLVVLGLYSITSWSSLLHYALPMPSPMTPKMLSLIWLDGIAGLLLVAFVLVASVQQLQVSDRH